MQSAPTFLEFKETLPNWLTLIVFTRPSLSEGTNRYCFRQRRGWRICSLWAVAEEHFDNLFNINVRGTLFTVQKALPLLNDGGSIILNASVASVKGTAAFGAYAASKAAIRSFVRTWTTDLRTVVFALTWSVQVKEETFVEASLVQDMRDPQSILNYKVWNESPESFMKNQMSKAYRAEFEKMILDLKIDRTPAWYSAIVQ